VRWVCEGQRGLPSLSLRSVRSFPDIGISNWAWVPSVREFRLEGSEERAFNRKERKELPQSSQSNSNLSHYRTVQGGSAFSRSHFFWISSGLFEAEKASTTEDTGDTEGGHLGRPFSWVEHVWGLRWVVGSARTAFSAFGGVLSWYRHQ
jgi:hypothetical protein